MAGLTILCCKDPGRTWGRYGLLRLVSISATVDLQLIDGALDPLGSSYVSDSELELERLARHRMIPAPPIRLLGWNNDLLLLIHLHTHQCLVKTLNHLTRSQHHHQRVVVASRIVQPRTLGLLLH